MRERFKLDWPNDVPGEEDFFDRERDREQIDSLMQQGWPRPILITGERRIGKTSLRNVAIKYASRYNYLRAPIALHVSSLEGFAYEVLDWVCQKLEYPLHDTGLLTSQGGFQMGTMARYINALYGVFRARGNQPVIIDIEEFETIVSKCGEQEAERIQDFLVKLIENHKDLPLKLLVTMIRQTESIRWSYPTTFVSLAEKFDLKPFGRPDTEKMIQELLAGYLDVSDRSVLDSVYRLSGGHPYYIKLIIRCLFDRYYRNDNGVVAVTEQHVADAVQEALLHADPELHVPNVIRVHMSDAERAVLAQVVRANGNLRSDALKPELIPTADGLVRRSYLESQDGNYFFKIGYLNLFLAKQLDLLDPPVRTPAVARGPLSYSRMQFYRGSTPIKLTHESYELLRHLYEYREEVCVPVNDLYDNVFPGGEFTRDERVRMVKRLVDAVRLEIEDDPEKPIYLIEVVECGYRLENVP